MNIRLDLAVVRVGDTKEVSALQFVPLGDEPLSVIARSGHQLARMGERMV